MRILIVSNLLPPYFLGGYEIACGNVARGLAARGHELLLLTSPNFVPGPPDPDFVRRDLHLHWYGLEGRMAGSALDARRHLAFCSNHGNTDRFIRALAEFQPEIVYFWNTVGIGGLALLDAANLAGAPWVMHLMDFIPGELVDDGHTPRLVRSLFGAADGGCFEAGRFISMSERLLEELQARAGLDFRRRGRIVPGWVDTAEIPPHGPYHRTDRTRFVSAGAINPAKGIDLILAAAAALRHEGFADFSVDIYGAGEISRYVADAFRLGVQQQVNFLGPRPQRALFEIYADRDAFLFPTWEREPFGFAPIEAAAAGCMPILTSNCGAAERLVNQVHCLKIERNAAELAAAMRRVVTREIDVAQIGQLAARLVREDLSFAGCLREIEAALTGAATPWDPQRAADPGLVQLLYTKHLLSESLRLGIEA